MLEIDWCFSRGKQLRFNNNRGLVRVLPTGGMCRSRSSAPRFSEGGFTWVRGGQLPTKLEWLRGLNALRVLAQVSAAEQIVGPERGQPLSQLTLSGDA